MKTITKMSIPKKILSVIMILLILGSLAGIVIFCFDFVNCWKWILLIICGLYSINIFLNIHIFFNKSRTDKEKKCWIFINVILIGLGPLLFLKYGYYAYYKNNDQKILETNELINKTFGFKNQNIKDNTLKILSNYSNSSCHSFMSDGEVIRINNLELLFEETIKLIRSAKKIILINFYIISDSIWLKAIINELLIKKSQGVKIFIEYDPFGSKKKLPKKVFNTLVKLGFEISKFKDQESFIVTAVDNNRSHKKSLIIDGEIALYGGINIGDEYLNFNAKYHYWFDEAYLVKGNIVNELIRSYIVDWTVYGTNKKDILTEIKKLNIVKNHKSMNNAIQLYDANPENNQNRMHHFISLAFSLAKKRIWINTPYLYLSETLIDELISLKRSGVDVKILLPYLYDNKKFILEINQLQYERLIKEGIEIYEIDAFNHRKSIIIDDYILIGTTNLDQRALCLNYENTLFTNDSKLLHKLEQEFKYNLSKSAMIKKKIKKPIAFYYKIFVKLLLITETLL